MRQLHDGCDQGEDGLQHHDVGERHAELVLPEERDGRDREEELPESGMRHQESDGRHAGRPGGRQRTAQRSRRT